MGTTAGASVATANPNSVYIGNGAGQFISTGTGNTGVGYKSLNGNTSNQTTGSWNTAIGNGALALAQGAAAANTTLGANTGASLTTGSNNVMIGSSVASTLLTTESGNILIGNSSATDIPSAGTNNWINIGNTIYGSSSSHALAIGNGVTSITAGAVLDLSSNNTSANSSILVPTGTTGAEPSTPVPGMMRYNTTTNAFEGYDGVGWYDFGGQIGTFAAGTAAAPGWAVATDTTSGLFQAIGSTLSIAAGGKEAIRALQGSGTVVNYLTATGASTGNGPTLASAGSDTNINLNLTPQGSGYISAIGSGTYVINASDTATSGTVYGVYSSVATTGTGRGVYGVMTGTANSGYAVEGYNSDPANTGTAVRALNISTGTAYGVFSRMSSGVNTGYSIYGRNDSVGTAYGVYGSLDSAINTGYSVYGANASTGTAYAVYGSMTGAANTGYAVYATNTSTATGYALYANSGLNYFGGDVGINVAPSTTKPLLVGSTSSNGNGAYLDPTGVWVNASDRRIKENIQPIQYGLDAVMKLQPVSYDMKDTHVPQVGFIAQDVLKVVPEVVGVPKDPEKEHYGLSYGNMVAVTVKAIQELKADNDNLKKEVAGLKVTGTAEAATVAKPEGGKKPAASTEEKMMTAIYAMGGGMLVLIAMMGGMFIHTNREIRKLRKQIRKTS